MKSNAIDVSLCIVNWNTVDLTLQLIESIYNTVKDLSIEIFVVDNASKDGSVEGIRGNYPQVIIIENNINIGYGAALNQALKLSHGRYKLVLNSDVILLENSLECLVTFLEEHQDVGAVGPISLNNDMSIGHSYGYFPRPGRMILDKFLGSLTPRVIIPPPLEEKPILSLSKGIEVEYIKGACILVRSELCKEIGLFDEHFFAYFEETDWCFRMKKRGLKRYLVSEAKIIHIDNASFSKVQKEGSKYFNNSKLFYIEKHHGRVAKKIYEIADEWSNLRGKIKKILLDTVKGSKSAF